MKSIMTLFFPEELDPFFFFFSILNTNKIKLDLVTKLLEAEHLGPSFIKKKKDRMLKTCG